MKHLTSLIEPVVHSTISVHQTPSQMGYGRVDNPTRLALEAELAKGEHARFALAFASGTAAIAAVFSLLKTGDVVLHHDQLYEGTLRMLKGTFTRFGVRDSSCDFSNVSEIRKNTKNVTMLMCESVTNPCLVKLDIAAVARQKGMKTIFVVDNTMSTPCFVKPLDLGADIVVSSLSKYSAGHHDVIAGAVMTNDEKLFKRLQDIQWTLGAIPGPQDCFLVQRGMQTLQIRMSKHTENARIIARFLENHPEVDTVVFPGDTGLISFWLRRNGDRTISFLKNLNHIRIAHSFGGTQTTVMHPRSMMTFSLSIDELERQHITANLIRMSVGIEGVESIKNDLEQALRV
ncbi:cystathionine gamma-synthase [Candidatus Roizmanbacteria bacterium CG03_land_8_20_14_0_80_39_12]|uniref:Cystathionine gamma-synthase n=1 Tax=Candidatus Roizmanbacteria bacterium CG03_land_8_20_14_0_80_39_12 TaxID=1974847 RepID=A0A2M7BRY0_9BACT|nr:MAG: cystathionine gamma-synthase [Candidatus Roizmanbacteria bacterium CG03_land_8_20_14_0_80_39_12]